MTHALRHTRRSRTPWWGILILLLLAGGLTSALGQTARVQLVHASPDPALAVVDVYLGDTMLVDNFTYLTATPFVDLPAGEELVVTIADSASTAVTDSIRTFRLQLDEGDAYHIVAAGVLDPASPSPNPDGLDIGFTLAVRGSAREANDGTSGWWDGRTFHAVPDAPTVDVVGSFPGYPPDRFIEGLSYGAYSRYASSPVRSDLRGQFMREGTNVRLLECILDASGLDRKGILSVLVGNLADSEGPSSIVVLPDGTVVPWCTRVPIVDAVEAEAVPGAFRLLDNYPNPFNPATVIRYEVQVPTEVRLTVHDALGREVARLVDDQVPSGMHTATWSARSMPSGVYFATLRVDGRTETRPMLLVR